MVDWLSGDPDVRYIGFLKQRGEVADYFKRFLGCNELLKNSEETKKLVTVLKRFAREQELPQEEEEKFFKAAHDFCYDCMKSDEPLSLDALSNAVWPSDPRKLQTALSEVDVQLSDGFIPDKRSLNSLVHIKAKTPYWSLDLQRHALSQGYAKYNKQKGQLVLMNLPAELTAELDFEIGDGE
jgi:nucleoid-associated protein